jgi:O-antigen/teichoic acid export membrane protein
LFGKMHVAPHMREIAWVVVAQGLSLVGVLASIKIASYCLGPADYGRLAAALAIVSMIQVCLFGAISHAGARFLFLARSKGCAQAYVRSVALLVASANALALVLWVLPIWPEGIGEALVSRWLLFAFLAAAGMQQVLLAMVNAARLRKIVATAQGLEAVGRPLSILAGVKLLAPTPTIVLGAYVLTAVAVATLLMLALTQTDTASPVPDMDASNASSTSLTSQMVVYALPFALFGVVGALGSHGERILLAAWVPWERVGVYALMLQLASMPTVLLTSVINQFYLPIVFQSDPGGTGDIGPAFRRYLMFSAAGTSLLAATVLILGPLVVPLISSRAFTGYEYLLAPLVVSAWLFGMGQQLVLPGMRLLKSFIYILPKVVHSAALFGLASLLVPTHGLAGMAAASLSSAALYLGLVAWANKRWGRS